MKFVRYAMIVLSLSLVYGLAGCHHNVTLEGTACHTS